MRQRLFLGEGRARGRRNLLLPCLLQNLKCTKSIRVWGSADNRAAFQGGQFTVGEGKWMGWSKGNGRGQKERGNEMGSCVIELGV